MSPKLNVLINTVEFFSINKNVLPEVCEALVLIISRFFIIIFILFSVDPISLKHVSWIILACWPVDKGHTNPIRSIPPFKPTNKTEELLRIRISKFDVVTSIPEENTPISILIIQVFYLLFSIDPRSFFWFIREIEKYSKQIYKSFETPCNMLQTTAPVKTIIGVGAIGEKIARKVARQVSQSR